MGIASEIRAEVARRGTTLGAVASSADMTRQSLSRKLNGHNDFTLTELRRVAAALGTTLPELITRADAPEPPSVVVEPEPARAEFQGATTVGRVGAALADVPVEALLEHEQACDSCWSLDDAARHLSGDEDPATHRSSDEEVA